MRNKKKRENWMRFLKFKKSLIHKSTRGKKVLYSVKLLFLKCVFEITALRGSGEMAKVFVLCE